MADTLDDLLLADATAEAGARFLHLVAGYLAEAGAGQGPVSTGMSPGELAERFREPLPRAPQPLDHVLDRLSRQVIQDANHLVHPMYLGHQVSAPLPATIWSESLIAALNNSVAVSEMSPTATAMEHQVIRWMADLAGYGPGAGGTLTSGGTEATFTALLAARAALLPDAWEMGLGREPPVVVYGEQAHYAISRAIGELGIGQRNGVALPMRGHRLDPDAVAHTLDELRGAGRRVMAVVATAGSTPTGSFDDLERIGAICEARGVWLHVDGAHGASALLSSTRHAQVRGIGRARSIAWDAHKMMLLPLAAGMVLVRDERDLERAFLQRAPYLFHATPGERIVDQGVRSVACSRRADVIKLWVALQRYGADALGQLYDRLCDRAMELHDALVADPRFEVSHRPESNILCFRWIGSGTLGQAALDWLNRELRERYNRSGAGWITTTVLDGRRVLRVMVMNPATRPEHLHALVEGLSSCAATLEPPTFP